MHLHACLRMTAWNHWIVIITLVHCDRTAIATLTLRPLLALYGHLAKANDDQRFHLLRSTDIRKETLDT